jgi:beta-galactosidase/beta-glucuronidase
MLNFGTASLVSSERPFRLMRKLLIFILLTTSCGPRVWSAEPQWRPAAGPLKTRWAKDVSPNNALPEYPRPQMVRKKWMNLNGLWDLAITNRDAAKPESFSEKILVPFPVESALSGVMKIPGENQQIWYRRTFTIPKKWIGQRILLHFGAVDFEATVWVNGKKVGEHRGGYDGFTFDITDFMLPGGPNELIVSAWDPTDAGTQPRGKQVRKPHSIWYTPTSGIWQTVWLEPVSAAYIRELKVTPDVDKSAVTVQPVTTAPLGDYSVEVTIHDGMQRV